MCPRHPPPSSSYLPTLINWAVSFRILRGDSPRQQECTRKHIFKQKQCCGAGAGLLGAVANPDRIVRARSSRRHSSVTLEYDYKPILTLLVTHFYRNWFNFTFDECFLPLSFRGGGGGGGIFLPFYFQGLSQPVSRWLVSKEWQSFSIICFEDYDMNTECPEMKCYL